MARNSRALPDLTGRRFGHLTARERVRITRGVAYLCDCDCGRTTRKMGYDLASGKATQCTTMSHTWIGQRYGRLTALRVDPDHTDRGIALIICRCDCGNTVSVQLGALVHGRQRSCGCLHREAATVQNATHVKEANKTRYVEGTSLANLSRTPTRNSTTGIRGVHWRPDLHKYIATIGFQNHTYYLGVYDDIMTAAAARRIAEHDLYDPVLTAHGRAPLSADEARRIIKTALTRLTATQKEDDHDAD